MENHLAVDCHKVRKHFGEGETRIEALRGVDFEARFGELSFLVGPSGCGKTTLISVIAGLLERTGGELGILGRPMDALKGTDRVLFRRKNVGFLFQQYNLLPALTAAENVAVPLLAAGQGRKQAVPKHRSCSSAWVSATAPKPSRRSCRAASSSASHSQERSSTSRAWSCATSPRPPSTTRTEKR